MCGEKIELEEPMGNLGSDPTRNLSELRGFDEAGKRAVVWRAAAMSERERERERERELLDFFSSQCCCLVGFSNKLSVGLKLIFSAAQCGVKYSCSKKLT